MGKLVAVALNLKLQPNLGDGILGGFGIESYLQAPPFLSEPW